MAKVGKVEGVGAQQRSDALLQRALAESPLQSVVERLNVCDTPQQRRALYVHILSLFLNHEDKSSFFQKMEQPFSALEYSRKVEFFDVMHEYAQRLVPLIPPTNPLWYQMPEFQTRKIQEYYDSVHNVSFSRQDLRYAGVLYTNIFHNLLPKVKEIEKQLLALENGKQLVASARKAFRLR